MTVSNICNKMYVLRIYSEIEQKTIKKINFFCTPLPYYHWINTGFTIDIHGIISLVNDEVFLDRNLSHIPV